MVKIEVERGGLREIEGERRRTRSVKERAAVTNTI